MALPATTQILNDIVARMANISIANGYLTDIVKIECAKLEPFQGYDLPAINVWPTALTTAKSTMISEERHFNIMIEAHDYTHDEPFSTVAERLAADIVTAINRHPDFPKATDSENKNLNATVSDCQLDGYDYEIGRGQKPFCGTLVRFTVKYNATKNDMFNYSR